MWLGDTFFALTPKIVYDRTALPMAMATATVTVMTRKSKAVQMMTPRETKMITLRTMILMSKRTPEIKRSIVPY